MSSPLGRGVRAKGSVQSEDEHAEVLEQYLQADEKEEHSARKFRFAAESAARFGADEHAEEGDDEGGDSDEGDRKPNVHRKEGEGDADCERVYARCNGHHKEGLDTELELLRSGGEEGDAGRVRNEDGRGLRLVPFTFS